MNIKRIVHRSLAVLLILAFVVSDVSAYAQGLVQLPIPGSRPELSHAFTPALVRGIRVYADKPFQFDFMVDSADSGLKGAELKAESEKLIRYFLASLTVPEDDLWVNLSPYEKDRIVPDELGKTEMGSDMLAQDYLLKQMTASLTNPESDIGKQFWQKVYARAYEKYGAIDVPTDTFNKVWIMPEKADVYVKHQRAFIINSRLKVMLDEDYVAASHQRDVAQDTLLSDIVREVFIPVLEKEVNEGRNFAQVRQIYHSLILAYWYKTALKDSILNKVYSDRKKVKGVDLSDVDTTQKIYAQYLDTFNKGVVNMIKDEYDPYTQDTIPRKYFAGGLIWRDMGETMNYVSTITSLPAGWASTSTMNDYSVNFVSVPRGDAAEEYGFTQGASDILSEFSDQIERLRSSFSDQDAFDGFLSWLVGKMQVMRVPASYEQIQQLLMLVGRHKGDTKAANQAMLKGLEYVADWEFNFDTIIKEFDLYAKAQEIVSARPFCAIAEINDLFIDRLRYRICQDARFRESNGDSLSQGLEKALAILTAEKNMRFMTKYFKKILTVIGENPLLKKEGEKEYRQTMHVVMDVLKFVLLAPRINVNNFQNMFKRGFYRWNEFRLLRPIIWDQEMRNEIIKNRMLYQKLSEGKTNELSNKEVTVVLTARGDHNGNVAKSEVYTIDNFTRHGHKVIYFEWGNLQELAQIVDLVKKTKKAKNVMINIHANQTAQGTYDLDSAYPHVSSLDDKALFASMDFFGMFSDDKNAVLVLAGCEAGKGGALEENWVNMFEQIRPSDKKVRIFGSQVPTDITRIIFSDNSPQPDIMDVEFVSSDDSKTYSVQGKEKTEDHSLVDSLSLRDLPAGQKEFPVRNMTQGAQWAALNDTLDFIIENNLNISLIPLPEDGLGAQAYALSYIDQLNVVDQVPIFILDGSGLQEIKMDPQTHEVSRRKFSDWNRLGIIFVPLDKIDKIPERDRLYLQIADGVDPQILKEMERSKVEHKAPKPVVIGSNQSMATEHKEGGIDFKTRSIPLNAQGQTIDFAMPANLERLRPEDVPGLVPVIINVTPVTDFYLLLGLKNA